MELELITSQVVGLSNEFQWSQTMVEGNFVATIEINGNGIISAKEEAGVFLTGLVEIINRHKPQEKEAFKRIVGQYIENSPVNNRITSLVVGLRSGNELFIYCQHGGSAVLKRGDLWSEIVKGEGLASGTIVENDLLVLTTRAFERLMPHERVISRFIEEKDPQIAGERIGAALHNFDDSKGAAAVFAVFKKSDPTLLASEQSQNITPDLRVEVIPETPPAPIYPKLEKPGILSRIKNIFPKKPISSSPIKIVVASPRKRILAMALVLIGLLGASFFVTNRRTPSSSNAATLAQIESLTFRIEEGEALSDLNALRAKTTLTSAEQELSILVGTLKKGTKERIETEQLLTRARNALGVVSKSYHVTPQVFADLSVVKPQARGDSFAIYEDTIVVLDRINNSIMTVDGNGSVAIVGGGESTPNPKSIAIHGASIFTLTDKGLIRIETGSKRQQVVVSDIGDVNTVADMVGYAGNVYVLDSGVKKIWKFAPSGNSFTTARPYLSENETIPLNVSKMAIDGSVWVLGENRIKKYVRGNEEFITIEGLDNPLVNASDIFIDDNSKYLYIYDSGTNRVVVLETGGTYNSEYIIDGVGNITDIVVSEEQKKIFLLSGSSIYSIDLQIETEN